MKLWGLLPPYEFPFCIYIFPLICDALSYYYSISGCGIGLWIFSLLEYSILNKKYPSWMCWLVKGEKLTSIICHFDQRATEDGSIIQMIVIFLMDCTSENMYKSGMLSI